MIIQKCDICLKTVKRLETIIIYKQSIDYCNKCKSKIEDIIEKFKKDANFEKELMYANLKRKEKDYIKQIKKEIRGGINE